MFISTNDVVSVAVGIVVGGGGGGASATAVDIAGDGAVAADNAVVPPSLTKDKDA